MLFQLLDQVCTEISKLDIKQNTPLMLKEIRRARPDVWESMKKSPRVSRFPDRDWRSG